MRGRIADAKAPFIVRQGSHSPDDPNPAAGGHRPIKSDLPFKAGALGAYQAGVYEALHQANIEPDRVTGVSIGAINAASLPAIRASSVSKNYAPSGKITIATSAASTPIGDIYRRARNAFSAMMTMALASQAFSHLTKVNPWLNAARAKTVTQLLRFPRPCAETLSELVDFSTDHDANRRFAVAR